MLQSVRIIYLPGLLEEKFAFALLGLTIPVRPELLAWTDEPTTGTDAHFLWLHDDDIREVLVEAMGHEQAAYYDRYLPPGRATRVPKVCCEYIYSPHPDCSTV